jgi:hypothetical protein
MKKEVYKPERRYFESTIKIEQREEGEDSRTIRGYAVVFNSWSRYLGWFKEKIDAKAFDECDMSDVVAVFNHDDNILFARTSSKTLTLGIDERGMWYEFEAPNTTAANDFIELVKRGDITGSSFRFMVENDNWIEDPDEGTQRVINKVSRLIDVSPVVFPAYAETDVAKRSFDEFKNEKKEEQGEGERTIPAGVSHAEADLELLKLKY